MQTQTIMSKDANKSITESLSPASLKECIVQSIEDTFTPIISEAPSYENGTEETSCDGLIGIISFVGTNSFSLMLGLPKNTAGFFSRCLLGFEIEYDTPDMSDLVGELVNLLAGSITAHLEKIGSVVHMSLPTVARGTDLQMLVPDGFYSMSMNFGSYDYSFWVKIVTMPSKHN